MAGVVRDVVSYPEHRYQFTARVASVLGVADLHALHEHLPAHRRLSDQDTPAHELFYAWFADVLAVPYAEFLRDEIAPRFSDPLCAQKVPTFRVSTPGSTAVKEFHRDADYNHQDGAVNFWVPLTRARETSAVWVESAPGKADYRPVNMEVGEMLRFDGVNLRHGNLPNETGLTRVSFDLRVIPYSQFRSSGLSTVTAGVRLEVGSYYGIFSDGDWAA